ncbi:MAG: response regulator transcription factor [Oscillospiraceae bacterium]|nr:response regulator transcription factor [Oscillospiraceae bacterium]
MYTVLICDDDEDIRRALEIYLTGGGYRVLSAGNGWETLKLLEAETVHLILLDIMMPVLDGAEVLTLLREKNNNVPVIFLTAKGEDDDKIAGLELGADDYITKPFNAREVLARVKALLRRYSALGGITPSSPSVLSLGGIALDDDSKTVSCDGEPVPVTPKEYDILKFFMEHPGKVFSSREIYRSVWQDTPMGTENTVAVHIRHLREKLEIDPANPRHLKVVWGKGYKFE